MSEPNSNKFNNPNIYETYVGRWSQLVARQFVDWLRVAPGCNWLDVGTGTGVLAQVILQQASPTKVLGIDPSVHYIEFAKQRISDEGIQFIVGEVGDLISSPAQFDVAVAGLVLNFTPSPKQTLADMKTLVKSKGVVASYVWDYADGMQMMRHFWDAAAKIDPSSREFDSGNRFAWCNPDGLSQLFQSQGLVDIQTTSIDAVAHFKNFDEYWQPFLAAQGSISEYIRSLDDKVLHAIRQQLISQLPTAKGGAIEMINRAWAIQGHVP